MTTRDIIKALLDSGASLDDELQIRVVYRGSYNNVERVRYIGCQYINSLGEIVLEGDTLARTKDKQP